MLQWLRGRRWQRPKCDLGLNDEQEADMKRRVRINGRHDLPYVFTLIALSLAVLLWIPTHIMTFNIRYKEDYEKAGIRRKSIPM